MGKPSAVIFLHRLSDQDKGDDCSCCRRSCPGHLGLFIHFVVDLLEQNSAHFKRALPVFSGVSPLDAVSRTVSRACQGSRQQRVDP